MRDRLLMAARAGLVLAVAGCTAVQPSASATDLSLAPATTTPTASEPAAAGEVVEQHVAVDGRERRYLLVLPAVTDEPVPLLVALHQWGGTPEEFLATTGFADLALTDGVMVAVPAGTEKTWNAGGCCGPAMAREVDDVAFIRTLLDHLEDPAFTNPAADPDRVYFTGFSNGGMLSYRLACELADRVTAIAPLAGALLVDCQPARPVSLLALHGTADIAVPFEGDGGMVASVEDTVTRWATFDDCTAGPTQADSTGVSELFWTGCVDGTRVGAIYALKQGHTWFRFYPDASEVIWDFFSGLSR